MSGAFNDPEHWRRILHGGRRQLDGLALRLQPYNHERWMLASCGCNLPDTCVPPHNLHTSPVTE
jgi:hypothetical protein